jgi:hypothetical protein
MAYEDWISLCSSNRTYLKPSQLIVILNQTNHVRPLDFRLYETISLTGYGDDWLVISTTNENVIIYAISITLFFAEK